MKATMEARTLKLLKDLHQADFGDEVILMFHKTGADFPFEVRFMDYAHTCGVVVTLGKAGLSEYDSDGGQLPILMDDLDLVAKTLKIDEKVTFAFGDETNGHLVLKSGRKKWAFRPLSSAGIKPVRIPNLECPIVLSIEGNTIYKVIDDAEAVQGKKSDGSMEFTLRFNDKTIHINGKDELREYSWSAEREELDIIKAELDDARSSFGFNFIGPLLKVAPGPVSLHFGEDYPMKGEYEFENGRVVFFIAPRISDDKE